jgi:hypothetical protein
MDSSGCREIALQRTHATVQFMMLLQFMPSWSVHDAVTVHAIMVCFVTLSTLAAAAAAAWSSDTAADICPACEN